MSGMMIQSKGAVMTELERVKEIERLTECAFDLKEAVIKAGLVEIGDEILKLCRSLEREELKAVKEWAATPEMQSLLNGTAVSEAMDGLFEAMKPAGVRHETNQRI